MKQVLIILFFMFSFSVYAQVGVNTESPKATLDVTAKKDVLSIDGLIPPKLTLQELAAKGDNLYGLEQDGTIIYITDIVGGGNNGQREYILGKGLYIFDAEDGDNGRWMCVFCYAPV